MPLQDLTPQLRTRLNRMERAVGWFVALAILLLAASFLGYLYHAAESKGWFKIKARFVTYVNSAEGISVGDSVSLMGFPVGDVLSVDPPPPRVPRGVQVIFEIREPYYQYIWTEGSYVKVNASGLLGKREFEVTRATNGFSLCSTHSVHELSVEEFTQRVLENPGRWRPFQNVYDAQSNLVFRTYYTFCLTNANGTLCTNADGSFIADTNALARLKELQPAIWASDVLAKHHRIASVWNRSTQRYEPWDGSPVYLAMDEAPALTDRISQMVAQVQQALPAILALTNRVNLVLDHTADVTSNLNQTIVAAHPLVTNVAGITGSLNRPGGLGEWVLNTNGAAQISLALTNVNTLLGHTDTNLDTLVQDVAVTLIHLGNVTSNLDTQVADNPTAISNVVKIITDSDDLIQGLKRHWLLRSAFKHPNTNAPPTHYDPAVPAKKIP